MKKKCMAMLLALTLLLLTGCSGSDSGSDQKALSATDQVPEVLSQTEYLLYQNIFYNDYGSEYDGKEAHKRGVFAIVQDAYNNRTRYYVWGYLDNTRCCDWQWEIVPKDETKLPPPGSLITVKGVFRADEAALDKYWITDAAVETEAEYTGSQEEINMFVMSCTLERVQMFNILYMPEAFEDKTFIAYGRIAGADLLEDPYYDGSWQIPFFADAASPAIGTLVSVRGRLNEAALKECTLVVMP